MFTAKNGDTSKCINAWVGLLVIAIVCTVVVLGVFVQFQTPGGKSRKARLHGKKIYPAAPVASTGSWNGNASSQQNANSIVF